MNARGVLFDGIRVTPCGKPQGLESRKRRRHQGVLVNVREARAPKWGLAAGADRGPYFRRCTKARGAALNPARPRAEGGPAHHAPGDAGAFVAALAAAVAGRHLATAPACVGASLLSSRDSVRGRKS